MAEASDIRIVDNHFSGSTFEDIYLDSWNKVLIKGNTFLSANSQSTIALEACKDVIISGNKATGAAPHHIHIASPGNNNYVIIYNHLINYITAAWTGTTADMEIGHNIT